jgi:hypothetical protein
MVGRRYLHRGQLERQPKGYTRHEVTASRAGSRPAGHSRSEASAPKIKLKKLAYLSAMKNTLSKHHVHHTFHHDHTSKTPRRNTHFFQNTPQKHSKTAKNHSTHHVKIFYKYYLS